MFFHQSAMV